MKRVLCFVLVIFMLLPMAVACKKDDQSEVGNSDIAKDEGTKETGVVDLLDTIPEGNYNGREYIMTVQSNHEKEVTADELTGDLANDTVYAWLSKIETKYGVDIISLVPDGDYWTAVTNENTTGGVTTAVYGHNAFELYKAVSKRVYKNWYEMGDMIDLEAERWDQIINTDSTYNGVLYGLTGDLGYSKLQGAMATFFNVGMLDELGYSSADLYKMVDEGEWTFEVFENIVKDIYIDTDYDNKRSIGDTFGYVTVSDNSHDIWFAQFGISLTSRDENNTITPTLYTPENIDVVDMIRKFYHENPGVVSYGYGTDKADYEDDFFGQGRAAMITTRLSYASEFAEELGVEDYGIMPAPKKDEDQPEYLTKLFEQYAIWCVGKNVANADVDFIAHITDALCAESSQTLYPKFYDILMKQRYSKDPDTARMVDLVMKNQSLDTTYMFGVFLDKYPHILRTCFRYNKDLSSQWAAIATSLPGKLEQMYALYQ
ncbi:MAG: hypothetical protein IJY47_03110 [Clostridia bacterium]|nr:hypothetical protein [Clostridia bacterium]